MSINILGHYRFEGNTNDSSVHGNNATAVSSGGYVPEVVTGIMGKGYKFTYSASENVSRISLPITELPRPFFISCWIQPSSIASGSGGLNRIFSYNSTHENCVALQNGILFAVNGPTNTTPTISVSVGVKYHVCVIFDENSGQNRARIYVNGNFASSRLDPISPVTLDQPAIGGTYLTNRTFNGIIDEFIIGTGAPSLPDIKRMMMGLRPINIDPQP